MNIVKIENLNMNSNPNVIIAKFRNNEFILNFEIKKIEIKNNGKFGFQVKYFTSHPKNSVAFGRKLNIFVEYDLNGKFLLCRNTSIVATTFFC